jgi:nucleoside-diphosphate-sugar epimerase
MRSRAEHARWLRIFVHVDDAALATLTAVEADVTGVYNIADGRPRRGR